ncbi:TetR/AcrR family transcriptional regulator [Palleronia rufa]|uniref:TetR/AcrR family transcriptional regulator n=1 Tax=Palleronia rufa TaxID=1530186 RepID=UPI00056A494B|nr:TetR/AcrR family transcriptional regulator [Palleronia rufa]
MNVDAQIKKGRKYDQVIEGAREVFMADGFEGASVDTIAKCAGVSKATLYSYFADKRLLFVEVACAECRRQAGEVIEQLDFGCPPREFLTRAGAALMEFMLSETGQQVFRISVAESERFPELGRAFWENGPGLMEKLMTSYFVAATARGELAIEDRTLAAHQFAELCKAEVFPRLCLRIQPEVSEADRRRILDGAVETWLARYGV